MSVTLIILFLIALCLAVHPFTTYPASLSLMRSLGYARPRVVPDLSAKRLARFALCMCAYNEERVIVEKCQNLHALKAQYPDLEIRIYVDAATDGTAALLAEHGNGFHIHVSPERHGKTHGMNLLISQTDAELIVFTDANVIVDLEAIHRLNAYFVDPEIGCVCGHLIYVNGNDAAVAAVSSFYWRIEERIKDLESLFGSVMGADGSIFAIRRSLHHAPPDDIIDDMYVSFQILCDGYKIVRAPDVLAYEEAATSTQDEFRRKVRISCQAFNVHQLLWPRLRKLPGLQLYQYVSHKLLRWFMIYSLTCATLIFEMMMISIHHGIVGVVLIGLSIGAIHVGNRLEIRSFQSLYNILWLTVGVGLGVYESLKGTRFQTWTPTSSITPRPD